MRVVRARAAPRADRAVAARACDAAHLPGPGKRRDDTFSVLCRSSRRARRERAQGSAAVSESVQATGRRRPGNAADRSNRARDVRVLQAPARIDRAGSAVTSGCTATCFDCAARTRPSPSRRPPDSTARRLTNGRCSFASLVLPATTDCSSSISAAISTSSPGASRFLRRQRTRPGRYRGRAKIPPMAGAVRRCGGTTVGLFRASARCCSSPTSDEDDRRPPVADLQTPAVNDPLIRRLPWEADGAPRHR